MLKYSFLVFYTVNFSQGIGAPMMLTRPWSLKKKKKNICYSNLKVSDNRFIAKETCIFTNIHNVVVIIGFSS